METISDWKNKEEVHYGLAGIYFDKTEITDICGTQCKLRYRGYEIDELAAESNYEKVAYLILHGEWPSDSEYNTFRTSLARKRDLPADAIDMLKKLTDAPPMAALRTIVSFIGANNATQSVNMPEDHHDQGLNLIAMIPSLIVTYAALRQGRKIPDPDSNFDHASDFLRRLTGLIPSPIEQRLMNVDFILHADHGANASTFAARIVTSTGGDIYSAVSAAIGAFAGRAHGGALEGVIEMLDTLESPEAAVTYIQQRLASGRAIMGFGHRVYRGEDPRTRHFKEAATALAIQQRDFKLLNVLFAVVTAMQAHKRLGIAPNADLYAALIYRLLGFPDDLSTTIFSAGRVVGWVAQVLEQQRHNILIRPRLKYVGPSARTLNHHQNSEKYCSNESYEMSSPSTY